MSSLHEDPTDSVLVLRAHLEQWQEVLARVHGYLIALDLADGYRRGKNAPEYSKLTNIVRNHSGRIKGYLDNGQFQD